MMLPEKPKRKEKPKNGVYTSWRFPRITKVDVQGASGGLIFGLIVLVVMAVLGWTYWTRNIGAAPVFPNTNVLPTAMPSPVPVAVPNKEDSLAKVTFLSATDASLLRTKENVINFALLGENGGVLYSGDLSIAFTGAPAWKHAVPPPVGFSKLTVKGTSVELEINSSAYVLNMMEPFMVHRSVNAEEVYLVDLQGNLWIAELRDLVWDRLSGVVATLPQPIAINPNLSFTY